MKKKLHDDRTKKSFTLKLLLFVSSLLTWHCGFLKITDDSLAVPKLSEMQGIYSPADTSKYEFLCLSGNGLGFYFQLAQDSTKKTIVKRYGIWQYFPDVGLPGYGTVNFLKSNKVEWSGRVYFDRIRSSKKLLVIEPDRGIDTAVNTSLGTDSFRFEKKMWLYESN